MPTLAQLHEVRSQRTLSLIAFLENLAEVVDVTPWRFTSAAFRASDAFVEPTVLTQKRKDREAERQREQDRSDAHLSPHEELLQELYEQGRRDHQYDEARWGKVLRPGKRLRVIVKGAPGGGKSCSTRYTVAELARESARKLKEGQAQAHEVSLPIWITAGDLFEQSDPALASDEAILRALEKQPGLEKIPDRVRALLLDGLHTSRAFVIIDGLDELVELNCREAETFRKRLGDLDTWPASLVITCRTLPWEEDADRRHLVVWKNLEEMTLKPLDAHQQRKFVSRFFWDRPGTGKELEGRLKRDLALRHHCGTPLILTFCAGLHWRGKLPETASPAVLYSQLLGEVLRGTWRKSSTLPSWTRNEVQIEDLRDFLSLLSWKLFELIQSRSAHESRFLAQNRFNLREWKEAWEGAHKLGHSPRGLPAELLQELLQVGLLVEGGRDPQGRASWSFAHRTMLEFLAAEGLRQDRERLNWLLGERKEIKDSPFWFKPEWLQMLTFLAGLLDGGDASRLIAAVEMVPLIDGKEGPPDDLFGQMLGLKCRLAGASPRIDMDLGRQIVRDWLDHFVPTLRPPLASLREHVLEAGRNLCRNSHLGQEVVNLLLTRLEAEEDPEVRWAITGALGKLGATEAVGSLLARLQAEEDPQVRMAIARALGELGDAEAMDSLLARLKAEEDPWVWRMIAEAVKELGEAGASGPLLASLESEKDPTFRWAIARALGKLGEAGALSPLLARLEAEEDSGVRSAIAGAVGELRVADSLGPLLARLEAEEDPAVRSAIAEALGELGEAGAQGPLLARLEAEEDPGVRSAIAGALGELGAVGSMGPLLASLEAEEDPAVRSAIADALGELGQAGAQGPLLMRLEAEEDPAVRSAIAKALGELGVARAVGPLLARLESEEERQVRVAIAQALGELGEEAALGPLLLRLEAEEDPWERWAIAGAVGELRAAGSLGPLLARLDAEKDARVRVAIAGAVGELRAADSLGPLLARLDRDGDWRVRGAIARALGNLGKAGAGAIDTLSARWEGWFDDQFLGNPQLSIITSLWKISVETRILVRSDRNGS